MKSILLIIIVFFGILFSLNIVSATSCGTAPSSLSSLTKYCIPISVGSISSISNAQFYLTFNALNYSKYLNGKLTNIYIYNSSGDPVYAWIQGNVLNEYQSSGLNTTSNVIIWINDSASYLTTTGSELYAGVGNTSENFMSNSKAHIGENPEISPSYAEYDNGNYVFTDYWNFAGTSCPTGLTCDLVGGMAVDNGLIVSSLSATDYVSSVSSSFTMYGYAMDFGVYNAFAPSCSSSCGYTFFGINTGNSGPNYQFYSGDLVTKPNSEVISNAIVTGSISILQSTNSIWYINDTQKYTVSVSNTGTQYMQIGATYGSGGGNYAGTVYYMDYRIAVPNGIMPLVTSGNLTKYVPPKPIGGNCNFAGAWEKNYYNRICFSSINYTGYVSGNDIGNVTYWYMNLSKINFQGLLGKTYDFMGYNGSSTVGNVTAYPFSEGYLLRNTTIYNGSYNGLVFYYNSSSFVPTYYYANYSESQANSTINSNSSISKTNYYTYGASSSSGTYLPIISYLNPSFNYTGVKWSSNTLSLNRTYGFTFSLGSTPYYIYETSPNTNMNFKVHYVTPCGNVYNEYYNYTGGVDYTYKITSAFFDIWPIKQVFSVIGTALFSVYEPNLPSSCSLISIPNVYPYFSYSPIGSSGIGIYANGTIFNTTVSKTPYLTGSFGLSNRVNLLVSVSNVAIPNDTIVIVPAYSTDYLNSTVQSNSTPINYKKNITSFPCYQNGQFCYEYRNLISHINWNFTLNTSTQTEALTNKSSCTNCVFTGLTPVWHYFNETSTYLEVKLPNYNISTVKGSTIPSCRFMFFDDYNMSTHTDYGKVNYTTTICNIHNNTATFILQNYTSDNVVIGSNASDNQIWDYWYNIENVSLGLPSSSVTSNFILAKVKPNSLYSLPHNQSSPSIPMASALVTFNRSLLYGSFVKWNESFAGDPNGAYGSIGYVTNTLIGADSGYLNGQGCYSNFYDYNTSGYAKNEYEYLILDYEGGTEPTPSIIGSSLGAYVGTGTGSTGANMGDSNQTAYVKGCGDPTYGGIVNVQTVKGISATVSRLYSTHYFRSPKILTLNISINQTICPVNFPTCNSGTGVNATSPLINSTSSGYISNASVFGNYTQTEKSLSYTFNLFGITIPYWAMFPFMIIALIVLAFSFMFNNDYLPLIIALAYLLSGLLNFIFYGNLGLFGISIIGIIYVAYYISSNLPKWLHGK